MKTKRKGKDCEIEDLLRQIRAKTSKGNYKEAAEMHNQLGNMFRQISDFDEALEHHKEELHLSTMIKDKMSVGIAHRNIGETYIEMQEEEKAIKHINLYLRLAREQSNMVEEQRAFITLGRSYLCFAENLSDNDDNLLAGLNSPDKREEHLNNALKYFRSGYNILEEHELQSQLKERDLLEMKCGACQNIGIVNDCKGKLVEAVSWLNKALSIGTTQGFHNYIHPCSMTLSLIYVKQGNLKEARTTAHQGVNAAIALGNFGMEIESWIQEAKVYFLMSEIEVGKGLLKKLRKRVVSKTAVRNYLEDLDPLLIAAIKISRAQDSLYSTSPTDFSSRMDLHEQLGDNFAELANYSEAINEYLHCVRCAKEIPGFESANKKKISRIYFSIAVTYKDQNDHLNALKYFREEMSLHSNNAVEKFKTQTNIALVLEKLNMPEEEIAKEYKKAIELAKQTRSLKREATALQNFGVYLKLRGNKEQSEELLQKVKWIKEENNLSDLEETEPDSQDMLDEEEIDLDNLSSEEESDMDDDADQRKNEAGGKRKKFSRVNELGETPLHVAAKKGDVKVVRRLLRQGHEVNPRDTAGWLPLHEACNFGHYDVVEELLRRKAWINDIGGQHCGKTTPLHDACSNGHIKVVQLLLKNGANVLGKEEQGNYPIDLLLNWKERLNEENEDLSQNAEEGFQQTKELLKSLMAKAGRPYESKDEMKARKRTAKKSSSPKFSLMKSRNGDNVTPVQVGFDNFDPDDGDAAVDLYSEAITGLRARNKNKNKRRRLGRDPKEENLAPLSPPPKGALISENKNVTEDWLLDDLNTDLKHSKRKRDPMDDVVFQERSTNKTVGRRKRVDVPEEIEKRARVLSSGSSDNESRQSSSEVAHYSDVVEMDVESELPDIDEMPYECDPDTWYDYPPTLNDEVPTTSTTLSNGELQQHDETSRSSRSAVIISSDSDSEDFQNIRPSTSKSSMAQIKRTSKLSRNSSSRLAQTRLPFKKVPSNKKTNENKASASFKRTSSSSSIYHEKCPPEGNTLRLKVHIHEQPILVPVIQENMHRTIDWLCQESSSRYFKIHGVKPILTLSTKDGALLSGSDIISHVLGDNETDLMASVSEFDLPPLTERFKTACAELEIPLDFELMSALNVCQSTSLLNLNDFYLRAKLGRSVCHSLLRQYSLRELYLSGCSLFDEGIKELSKVMSTLPNVCVLNLSMNGMTSIGFQHFVEAFTGNGEMSNHSNLPLSLASLDLSHNPIGNSVGRHLSELLSKLSQLKQLYISDCSFTVKLFTNSRTLFIDALNKSKLEELDISYNDWGELGIEKFLQKLNPSRLKSFDCTACGVTDSEAFAQVMCNFFSRNEDCCQLKNLKLTDCSLTDETMKSITEQFSRLVSLDSLTLSNNESLTLTCLETVLEKCVEAKIPLQRLDIGCCPVLWERAAVCPERLFNILEMKMQTETKLSYLRMTIEETDKDDELSKNERKVASIYEDYSGSSSFEYKRKGNSIIYELLR